VVADRRSGGVAARLGHDEYLQLVHRIQQAVDANVSATAKVAVVSRGDSSLLDLGGRKAWHFPMDEHGAYAGYHPADSDDAIARLRGVEARGADHILFPGSALWWLEHYTGFNDYLQDRYELVFDDKLTCLIYARRNGSPPAGRADASKSEPSAAISSDHTAAGEPDTRADRADGVRLIAFYLPQFHPIPENDVWWGNGFTEWTNVSNARPLFPGHYQPRLPGELGYYDLRSSQIRSAQAAMAKSYGLHGFCFYHYWFAGKQLLEFPFNEILRSGEPDFPFCLCWANEPWSRRWDGQPRDVLQAQSYSTKDDIAHIRWLLPALADPRAIKIDGKPVFIVYQGRDLPSPSRTTELWREEAVKAGLGELYLMSVETGRDSGWDATREGFDARVLFQPQFTMLFNSKTQLTVQAGRPLRVYDYQQAWGTLANPKPAAYHRYDTVCPGWDNTARRGHEGVVLHGSTPEAYENWLRLAISNTEGRPESQRIVFVNAWNEWAEGCYLEPDERHGRSYLEATQRALQSVSRIIRTA
jgi:hypothetical protein